MTKNSELRPLKNWIHHGDTKDTEEKHSIFDEFLRALRVSVVKTEFFKGFDSDFGGYEFQSYGVISSTLHTRSDKE